VDAFARRLQVQERLTHQIAEDLQRLIEAKGVAVQIEASHLCMMMRGVQKQQSRTVTRTFLGAFQSDMELRREVGTLFSSQ
jgi:GTP cyclohydrolase I